MMERIAETVAATQDQNRQRLVLNHHLCGRARLKDSECTMFSIQIHNDIDALDPIAWNAFVSRAAVRLEVPHLRGG